MQSMSQTARPSRMTAQRMTGLVFAGLLQVVLIWAIIEGLNIKVWHVPETKTVIDFIRGKTIPHEPPLTPKDWAAPQEHQMQPPVIVIDDGGHPPGITQPPGQQGQPGSDFGPMGIAATHTTPPYPPLEARLGESGTVWLRLTISPQGVVTDAAVMRSSGYEGLDQAARYWVVTHWRYHPATHLGTPVPALADIQVQFDLRNAH